MRVVSGLKVFEIPLFMRGAESTAEVKVCLSTALTGINVSPTEVGISTV